MFLGKSRCAHAGLYCKMLSSTRQKLAPHGGGNKGPLMPFGRPRAAARGARAPRLGPRAYGRGFRGRGISGTPYWLQLRKLTLALSTTSRAL
jgi:hypothetical protein